MTDDHWQLSGISQRYRQSIEAEGAKDKGIE